MKKALWAGLGVLCTALAAVGVAVPVLPSVPFLLLAAFAWMRASHRLGERFTRTRLYRRNLESYVRSGSMTRGARRRVMLWLTAVMGTAITVMCLCRLYVPGLILSGVWIAHMLYFLLAVKVKEPPCLPGKRSDPEEKQKTVDSRFF